MPSTRPAILTHLPAETKAEIQRRALALDRSMAWWVREALAEKLERECSMEAAWENRDSDAPVA